MFQRSNLLTSSRQETILRRPVLQAVALAALLCFGAVQAFALQILELRGPYSFVVDPATKEYFISSINGDEDARDNNGFITKLDESGKVVGLKFIEGGRDGVTLHAPRGLAIVGQTLYVADLDHVWGFDKATGKLLLGANGYATSLSPDDRWLACLQHRYATPQPGADVGSYEAVLLVDMGRVRGAETDDATVFRTLVSDPHGRLMNARIEFVEHDRVRLYREKPPLDEEYTLDGEPVKQHGRRWYWLWLH